MEAVPAGPSVRRQCRLAGVARSTVGYVPAPESDLNLELMRQIDWIHIDHPVYGSPRMTAELRRLGWRVNRKRVSRFMRKMGIEAIYPKPRTSTPTKGHSIFPHLLRGREIRAPDEVWCADITYVPMACGFMYLVAVMDGSRAMCWRGGCQTPSILPSALMPSTRP